MESGFLVHEQNDPTLFAEWHFHAHATAILGDELMSKLAAAGLQVVPTREGLEKVFGPSAGQEFPALPRVGSVLRTDLGTPEFVDAYTFTALEEQELLDD